MNDLNTRLIPFDKRKIIKSEPIKCEDISIVIPVKDQQKGIDHFLQSFFETNTEATYPVEIIIVDNNSTPPIAIHDKFLNKSLPVRLYQCKKQGAAAARNLGVNKAKGKWILFTDSDCIATDSFITGYLGLNSDCVAYSGHVLSYGTSLLDRYYDSQGVLIPPKAQYGELTEVPMYIVTANAIVFREAYLQVGGFNESYPAAGGEDEDFSMRLWQSGNINYASKSLIFHDYQNGLRGFAKRFINYGRGAFITETNWNTKKKPRIFQPIQKTFANKAIAYLQFALMLCGYWEERSLRNENR